MAERFIRALKAQLLCRQRSAQLPPKRAATSWRLRRRCEETDHSCSQEDREAGVKTPTHNVVPGVVIAGRRDLRSS